MSCQPIKPALPPCIGSQNMPSMVCVFKSWKNGDFSMLLKKGLLRFGTELVKTLDPF